MCSHAVVAPSPPSLPPSSEDPSTSTMPDSARSAADRRASSEESQPAAVSPTSSYHSAASTVPSTTSTGLPASHRHPPHLLHHSSSSSSTNSTQSDPPRPPPGFHPPVAYNPAAASMRQGVSTPGSSGSRSSGGGHEQDHSWTRGSGSDDGSAARQFNRRGSQEGQSIRSLVATVGACVVQLYRAGLGTSSRVGRHALPRGWPCLRNQRLTVSCCLCRLSSISTSASVRRAVVSVGGRGFVLARGSGFQPTHAAAPAPPLELLELIVLVLLILPQPVGLLIPERTALTCDRVPAQLALG